MSREDQEKLARELTVTALAKVKEARGYVDRATADLCYAVLYQAIVKGE